MKVVALTKYGSRAASTRQRFLQYRPALQQAGIELTCSPMLGNDYLGDVLDGRRPSRSSVAKAYARRLAAIVRASRADVVWLHCEFLPYWPGFAEQLAAWAIARPIVYDLDDAIFHMYDENASWPARLLLKGKLEGLLRRSAACLCGNSYLLNYAARYCANSMVLPTVVDTSRYKPAPAEATRPLTIGWIGSPSTWANVRPLLPALRDLTSSHGMRVRAVGAGRSAEADRFPGLELVEWSEATEIDEVQSMDIGIMPLLDLPFQRGKSGYKLIQYMACGLPVIASPVGVNSDIVEHGRTGFLASRNEEWIAALTEFAGDADRRRRMGEEGRRRAVRDFSLATHAPKLVDVMRSVGGGPPPEA